MNLQIKDDVEPFVETARAIADRGEEEKLVEVDRLILVRIDDGKQCAKEWKSSGG